MSEGFLVWEKYLKMKQELLKDISTLITAIEQEIDAYIVAYKEKHPLKKKMIEEALMERKKRVLVTAEKMTKKYAK